MFICSICGKNVDGPVVFTLDPTHPICDVCVNKFDDLIKNPDKDAFLNAYSYFDSVEKTNKDPIVTSRLDYFLKQNEEKFHTVVDDLSHQKINDFINNGNEEIVNLRESIEIIKKEKIEKEEKEAQEKEKKDREELLESLGLFTSIREYISIEQLSDYMRRWTTNEEKVGEHIIYYNKEMGKIFPDLKDEEYEQIKKIVEEKKSLEDEKKQLISSESKHEEDNSTKPIFSPVQNEDEQVSIHTPPKEPLSLRINKNEIYESFAEGLMKLLACLIWIGGLIISIVISRIPGKYSWETEFSWKYFWISILFFLLSGAFTWCLAELFGNLNIITRILYNFQLDQYYESDRKK